MKRTYLEQFDLNILVLLEGQAGAAESAEVAYNPWPYYSFTGKLRPWKQTPVRTVIPSIGRPDYADHPVGKPLSEESFRGKLQCKVYLYIDQIIQDRNYMCR